MIQKLKTCRGSTIAEMLVAVALLALLTAGGITATSAVMADYASTKEAANADILASTVIETLTNEVRLGRNITKPDPPTPTTPKPSSTQLTLDSAFFGENTTLQLDDGHLVAVVPSTSGSTKQLQLFSTDTYNGLKLGALSFAAAEVASTDKTEYTISFTVLNGSNHALWDGSTVAVPMQ